MYRDATNAATFPQTLVAAVGQGEPCAAAEPVTYDEHGRAVTLTAGLERDEQAGGVEAALVYTFANRHLSTTDAPERDVDLAARGIVHVRSDGPWRPKAALHALAEHGRSRVGHHAAVQRSDDGS